MQQKKTIIILAFPGVGKTYFKQNNEDLKILDTNISQHSDIVNHEGFLVDNPDFPKNYIEYIKEQYQKNQWDYILMSTDQRVRYKFAKTLIPHYVVYPHEKLKDEYIERYKNRGDDQNFIKLMSQNFQKQIQGIDLQFFFEIHTKIKIGKENIYLNDVFRSKK